MAQGMTKSSIKKQRVSGVILIDKPQGLTSQQVVSKVKYLFKSDHHDSKKAGHTGTLDPMATGLLPVCMGEATKFSHYQLDADKSYEAVVKLGSQTDTGDAEGSIIANKQVPVITQSMLDNTAQHFTGTILQIPPMYSALKKEGKKLYEYARAGIEVERPARPITIRQLSLTMGECADELRLSVTCSKGTYIRVLGEDIALYLGTLGHLTALRRTQVGDFNIEAAIDLDALESLIHAERFDHLLGIDACIDDLPRLEVTASDCERLHMGQRLNVYDKLDLGLKSYLDSFQNDKTCDIRLFDDKDLFLGLGKLEPNGRLQPKKMIQR